MKNKELEERRAKIIKGLEQAYKKLIEFKKLKNTPLIIFKDGEIIELDPNKALPDVEYKWH